ncbi:MAG: signal peptidase II [Candidatus Kapaibacterium sp.]
MMRILKEQRLFLVTIALILADQVTKLWVKGFDLGGWVHEGMPLHSSVPVVGELVRWTYVENPGMAFGISFGDGKIFLSLFSIVAAGALAWYLHRIRRGPRIIQIGVMLLLAGAAGNLIDRVFYGVLYHESPLFYGKVVDFIDVDCPDFTLFDREITRWYVFNIADACVSCGIVLLLLFNHRIPSHTGPQEIGSHGTPAQDLPTQEPEATDVENVADRDDDGR